MGRKRQGIADGCEEMSRIVSKGETEYRSASTVWLQHRLKLEIRASSAVDGRMDCESDGRGNNLSRGVLDLECEPGSFFTFGLLMSSCVVSRLSFRVFSILYPRVVAQGVLSCH